MINSVLAVVSRNRGRAVALLSAGGALVLFLLALPKPAAAYVDPGTGAMIWQMAAAGVLGSLFFLRRAIAWVRARLGIAPKGADVELEK